MFSLSWVHRLVTKARSGSFLVETRAFSLTRLASLLLVGCLVLGSSLPSLVSAAPNPRYVAFSARLQSVTGNNLNGTYSVLFSLYTVATGGTAVWSETQTVAVEAGNLTVNLGSVTAIPASITFDGATYYLGIKVGDDAEMSPRRQLTSVPSAFNADTVDGAHAGTSAGNVLKLNDSGNISIDGGASLGSTLGVTGATTLSSTLAVTGASTLSGAATLGSTLSVTGATTLSSTLAVTGAGSFSSTLAATGATTLSSTLGVTGATTLSSTLGVTGAATLSSTLDVTGAATLASTLGVTGATTLSSTLAANGAVTITSITSPQLTTRYDSSNYLTLGIGSTGAVTLDATGTGAAFTFSDGVTANTFASSGATLTGGTINSIVIGGSTPAAGTFTSLTANGTTTLGDASADTIVVNAATATVANDTDITLSGGVNGLSLDGTTFSVDATNNRLGLGIAAPATILHVYGTTEQLRLGYDATNYLSTTVSSSGNTTFDTTGTTGFSFSDAVSIPGAGASSLRLGSGSLAAGSSSIAIGTNATAPSNSNVVIGAEADGTEVQNVAIGYNASAGSGGAVVAIGYNVVGSGSGAISIGSGTTSNGQASIIIGSSGNANSKIYSIGLGNSVSITEHQQLVLGSSSYPLTTGFIGSGVTSTSPSAFSLSTTGGSGTDVAGANFTLAAGSGTGAGAGGTFTIKTAAAGSTGTTLNSGTARLTILPSGEVGIGATSPGQEFEVDGDIRLNANGTATANGICHSGADSDTTFTDRDLVACSGSVDADYAEKYPVEDGIGYGEVVAIGPDYVTTNQGQRIGKLTRATAASNKVIGVVSNNYSDFTSAGNNIAAADNPMPVALVGRVPVKVDPTSASITKGDLVKLSATANGKVTKHTSGSAWIIGRALEDWSSADTVMIYVTNFYYQAAIQDALTLTTLVTASVSHETLLTFTAPTVRVAGNLAVTGGLTVAGDLELSGRFVATTGAIRTLASGENLTPDASRIKVVGAGAVTLVPGVTDGRDGQVLIIQGTDDTNTVAFTDFDSNNTSNIQLGSTTRTLGKGDILELVFDNDASLWYEVSYTNH